MNFCFSKSNSLFSLCGTKCTHYSNLSFVFAFFKNYIFTFVYIRTVTFLSFIMKEPGTVIDGDNTTCVLVFQEGLFEF